MNRQQINEEKAEQFGNRLVGMLNDGSLAVMVSIGHRTGLLDAMSELPPATSEEIALAAGLHERYVREWLSAMATGGILEIHPNGRAPKFHLPAEHAMSLTREAGPDNFGVFTQYIGLLGAAEDHIVRCFREGGGVPYSEYGRFHEVMAEDSSLTVLSSLFDSIIPLAPELIERLEGGIQVLDVGCGSGRAVNMMAGRFPNSRFTGYDLSEEAIQTARTDSEANPAGNTYFGVRDLTTFDTDAPESTYDLITAFDAIHDQARPDRVLAGIFKALTADGVFLMQDISASSQVENNFGQPLAPLLYTISTMHCTSVSLSQGGLGLGTMWGREKAEEMLKTAGFQEIEIHSLPHDIQNDYYVIRK